MKIVTSKIGLDVLIVYWKRGNGMEIFGDNKIRTESSKRWNKINKDNKPKVYAPDRKGPVNDTSSILKSLMELFATTKK